MINRIMSYIIIFIGGLIDMSMSGEHNHKLVIRFC